MKSIEIWKNNNWNGFSKCSSLSCDDIFIHVFFSSNSVINKLSCTHSESVKFIRFKGCWVYERMVVCIAHSVLLEQWFTIAESIHIFWSHNIYDFKIIKRWPNHDRNDWKCHFVNASKVKWIKTNDILFPNLNCYQL